VLAVSQLCNASLGWLEVPGVQLHPGISRPLVHIHLGTTASPAPPERYDCTLVLDAHKKIRQSALLGDDVQLVQISVPLVQISHP
jgi:hypothetical protein